MSDQTKKKSPRTLGERIVSAYQELGWSRYRLAKEIGATYPSVMRWESGKTSPSNTSLAKVSKATGKSIEWLRGEEKSSSKPNHILIFNEWLGDQAPDDITQAEIDTLKSIEFHCDHPGMQFYSMTLLALRMTKTHTE